VIFDLNNDTGTMFNNDQDVQRSDTTGVDGSNGAGYLKNVLL
jgi:hypothetical protein